MQVIDGIQNVTLANGVVRIQTVRTGADGQARAGEEIAIPASQYGTILQALQSAGQDLQNKLSGDKADAAKSSGDSASSGDGAESSEKVDFSNI